MIAQDLPVSRAAWNLRTRRPWKRADITDQMVIVAYNDAARMNEHAERIGAPHTLPYELLMEVLGCPFKVAYAAMIRAADRGFIEYGVSLRTGWITPKALALFGIQEDGTTAP